MQKYSGSPSKLGEKSAVHNGSPALAGAAVPALPQAPTAPGAGEPPLVQVRHRLHREGRELATVQVVRGQVDVGMALETVGTGARWRVIGIGLMSAEGFSQGLRSLILQPLDRIQEGKELLNEGDRLLAVI